MIKVLEPGLKSPEHGGSREQYHGVVGSMLSYNLFFEAPKDGGVTSVLKPSIR